MYKWLRLVKIQIFVLKASNCLYSSSSDPLLRYYTYYYRIFSWNCLFVNHVMQNLIILPVPSCSCPKRIKQTAHIYLSDKCTYIHPPIRIVMFSPGHTIYISRYWVLVYSKSKNKRMQKGRIRSWRHTQLKTHSPASNTVTFLFIYFWENRQEKT